MQLFNKNIDYAVRALAHLAGAKGQLTSSRAIADCERIPLQFVRRLLQDLVREGWVESKEGATGGVRLAADPTKLRVSDVIRLYQGNVSLSTCMFRNKICPNRKQCVLRKHIVDIESMVESEFDKITIAKLAEGKE